MKKYIVLASTLSLAIAASTQAAVTINFTLGQFYESDGTSLVNSGTVGLLLSNNNGDSTSTLTQDLIGFDLSSNPEPGSAVASSTTIGNFEVLGIYQADVFSGYISQTTGTVILDNGIDAGDDLVFVWLPGLENLSGNIAAGQSFGVLTGLSGAQNDDASGAPFQIPTDGSTVELTFTSASASGKVADSEFTADQVTAIPEPSSFALIGLGALATLFRRRR